MWCRARFIWILIKCFCIFYNCSHWERAQCSWNRRGWQGPVKLSCTVDNDNNQYHGCRCYVHTRSQVIRRHCTDHVCPEYSDFSSRRVKLFGSLETGTVFFIHPEIWQACSQQCRWSNSKSWVRNAAAIKCHDLRSETPLCVGGLGYSVAEIVTVSDWCPGS